MSFPPVLSEHPYDSGRGQNVDTAMPDTAVALDGFKLLQADKTRESGKRKGGGLAVFVKLVKWCNPGHITIKEQLCCRDTELLTVSMRPYYLPRKFLHVIAIAVHIPPSANAMLQERPEQTLSSQETEVIWSAGGTPEDLL